MEQRKRPGGNGGLGYYTSWEKSEENGCIYCGQSATTREHVPSKTFLSEPFPENLPTIPACFKCNNGYSDDEKYVACFLDKLKSYVYTDYSCSKKTCQRIEKDKLLQKTLMEQLKVDNGKVYFQPDEERILRILVKLARGHAGFELDHVCFDDSEIRIWYDFVFNMSEQETQSFCHIPTYDVAPEIGARGMFLIQNIGTGEASTFANWNDVQDGQYRYQVAMNGGASVTVKLVIYEFLYCQVDFE